MRTTSLVLSGFLYALCCDVVIKWCCVRLLLVIVRCATILQSFAVLLLFLPSVIIEGSDNIRVSSYPALGVEATKRRRWILAPLKPIETHLKCGSRFHAHVSHVLRTYATRTRSAVTRTHITHSNSRGLPQSLSVSGTTWTGTS